MTDNSDPNKIIASPTKTLFIDMLVKDIPLTRAIIDLVDNCVDGARRIRRDSNYDGLWVRLKVSRDRFTITDNCGGISVRLARQYAFRFGRPDDMEPTPHSVGQFGVGMKRAIFKLGTHFRIQSTTDSSYFVVDEDVEEWKSREEAHWTFRFDEVEENLEPAPPPAERGTKITVSSLHEAVSSAFGLDNYRGELRRELTTAHQRNMEKGLTIVLNNAPLTPHPLTLLQSDDLKPAYFTKDYNGRWPSPVKVKIYAGVSESSPPDAGWYVFCNDRMLLEHDQTSTTGWGEGRGTTIPKFHNQFARFRGFAFFDSDDASLLPWNTTKTGVDTDSPLFRGVRLEMIRLMRPVINFLNNLDAEKENGRDTGKPLTEAIQAAAEVRLAEVTLSNIFLSPDPTPPPPAPRTALIRYRKPVDEIEQVKQQLRVRSNKQVGEKTFEYFLEMECGEE
jgi:hypothetical protein